MKKFVKAMLLLMSSVLLIGCYEEVYGVYYNNDWYNQKVELTLKNDMTCVYPRTRKNAITK